MEWININDDIPEEGQWVLALSQTVIYKKMYEKGIFYDGDTYCYCPVGEIKEVTHWMPLPELPKE